MIEPCMVRWCGTGAMRIAARAVRTFEDAFDDRAAHRMADQHGDRPGRLGDDADAVVGEFVDAEVVRRVLAFAQAVAGEVERVTVDGQGPLKWGRKWIVPAAGIHVAAMDEHQVGRIRFLAGATVEYTNLCAGAADMLP